MILVTGAAGYLGSVLVPHLLSQGYEVMAVDTFRHGENSLAAACDYVRFHVVRGDARDMEMMKPLIDRAEIVIPLAAFVGVAACKADQIGTLSTNWDAIKDLCDLLHPDQKIIFPTTNSGYGIGSKEPCTEESPLRPLSLYGQTKMQAEQIVLRRENAISLRLATVFGASPRMRMDLLVNDMVYRALQDKAVVLFESEFRRNYLHIRDVAHAIEHCLIYFTKMRGWAYNVGDSRANLTKYELCMKIKEHLPWFQIMEAPVGSDPDRRDYLVSNARMEATGWHPSRTLDNGIDELIKLYTTLSPRRYVNA